MARSKWASTLAAQGRDPMPHWGKRKAYEVPYAKKQRMKRLMAAKDKVIAREGKIQKNRKTGGDFWGDVGDFFTKTLPDVAMQALPMLLTAL